MGSPDCICDGTDFGDYAACGWKTVPEVYQAVHGNRSDSFYACSGVSDIWNRYDRIHD